MNILVIYNRKIDRGSTKYRIVQYTEYLRNKGFDFDFVKRKAIDGTLIRKIPHYDAVFNQRALMRTSLARKIITCSRRVVFDFDDAIYTRPGRPHSWLTSLRVKQRLNLWLKRADTVTTANHFLANYARKYSPNVEVIPNAIDLTTWKPRGSKKEETIRIGWAGAPVNIPKLEQLEPVLTTLLKKYPFVNLAVFSGKKPRLTCRFEYHPFEPDKEHEFVQGLDVGLLPLVDEEYSKGKSPIKAIQYLACGVSVVGNVIGATGEILNEANSIAVSSNEEWLSALEQLINDPNRMIAMGAAGREFAEKNHDIRSTAKQRIKVFLGNALPEVL
jgi:glycosyltransferase involved in cell wall biosynthesis